MVYTNLDSVALGFWHPSSEVGEYGLAKRLLQASTSAATAFGVLMISRASSSHAQNDSAQFSRLVLWSFRFLLLIALPMALGMGLIRHELALFFGGPAFAETATALALVAPNIFFVAIGYLALIQILIPRGLEKRALVCWSLGGAWAALMVPLLVPKWGLVGAGVVCLTSEALVATLAVWFTRRELVAGLHGDELLIAALACCAMVAAVLLTQRDLDTSEYQPLSRLVALLATGSTAYLGTVGVGWCGLSFVLKRHPA
jgi:O-antigen/teichoic acid export membrane protein